MKKILVITKDDISSWKSCQHITSNLLQSYQQSFSDSEFQFLKVEEHLSYFLAYKHAKQIKEIKVDQIVWLDHKPCAAIILNALNEVYSDTPHELKPKILIHLFGDFVLDCQQWESTLKAINQYPVHFFVASDRQKLMASKLFVSNKDLFSVVPFPVDERLFSLKGAAENRKAMRAQYDLKDELVLIYTGRISFQKNVEAIINTVERVKSFIDKKIEIWIAGPWDDILMPYYGQRGMPGSHYAQFNAGLIDKNLASVKFLGSLETRELQKVYQAADLFVSFSTYNDEDYGMSVAEALMTGLPCVLSDWGGFASFANYSKEVELVPVEPRGNRMLINSQMAQKKLLKKIVQVLEKNISGDSIVSEATASLSITAVGKKVKELSQSSNFNNDVQFSGLFYKLCALFQVNPQAPFKNNTELYNEIYGDYASNRL